MRQIAMKVRVNKEKIQTPQEKPLVNWRYRGG